MNERPKILLVDDEPSLVKIVSKRLEAEGFEVCTAIDGEEALREVVAQNPHLIILDVMLPKLNGYEVCKKLKSDTHYQKIPILLFTARVQDRDEKIGFESGADAYLRKPFRAPELLEKIRVLLGQNHSLPECLK
jgi:two-component system alkaline phosphatase synthesis response regulator PhoP